jgi:two-component system response regulator BaeR
MLPGKDGLEVCKEIRQFSNVPIMMLTAKVEEIDRLLGLELGADDYICKPYSPREVVARVKAILRRTTTMEQNSTQVIAVDEPSLKVNIKGLDLDLTLVEFQLFSMLHSEPGRIFSRDQIMSQVYSDYRVVSDRTIDSHVKKLRKKIQQALPDTELIFSVYGAGYKFEPL